MPKVSETVLELLKDPRYRLVEVDEKTQWPKMQPGEIVMQRSGIWIAFDENRKTPGENDDSK